ncbi:MAG: hypothetical protein F6K54_19365 [Okeania sp. SIO3B5]|nr:hypothetical protein [Okeania sp. SIO3B5]NEO55045.1 hypothetical protein [Okeania sp. SIO3B5]
MKKAEGRRQKAEGRRQKAEGRGKKEKLLMDSQREDKKRSRDGWVS